MVVVRYDVQTRLKWKKNRICIALFALSDEKHNKSGYVMSGRTVKPHSIH